MKTTRQRNPEKKYGAAAGRKKRRAAWTTVHTPLTTRGNTRQRTHRTQTAQHATGKPDRPKTHTKTPTHAGVPSRSTARHRPAGPVLGCHPPPPGMREKVRVRVSVRVRVQAQHVASQATTAHSTWRAKPPQHSTWRAKPPQHSTWRAKPL